MYRLSVIGTVLALAVVADTAAVPANATLCLDFKPYNIYDNNLQATVQLFKVATESTLDAHKLRLQFIDITNDSLVYSFEGTLGDSEQFNSLVAAMEASEEFEFVELTAPADKISSYAGLPFYNPLNSLGNKKSTVAVPAGTAPLNTDAFSILTSMDNTPQTLYMQFKDDVQLFSEMLRTATHLNVRLWVELDPTLTVDQVILVAKELDPGNHRVRYIWSPILARPANAVGLRGRKTARVAGGFIVAAHQLRDASVNEQGIPALQDPIAGYDYPITFVGIEQRKDVVLDDPTRKRLADAKINVVQRIKYPDGVRFIIGDGLTTYPSNNSLLKLSNASDISMFIDNRVKEIVFKHLLKSTDHTIDDATKEIVRFLEACTAKERQLLTQSQELGGYYQLSLTPREDRPYDAIRVKLGYRTAGMTRAAYLDTVISK